METPITPLEHTRGSTLEFTGWAYRNGEAKTDLPNDSLIFSIADHDTMVPVLTRETGHPDVAQLSTGQYQVRFDAATSRRSSLPNNEYWVHVALIDSTTGKEWCIGQGLLTLRPSPRG